jgi:acetyl esterase/lipase
MQRYSWRWIAILLPCASAGCSRAPAGYYEIQAAEKTEFIQREGKPLVMDIYMPVNGQAVRPAVVLFHGGGWRVNNRSEDRAMAQYLASMGYTAATADYRLCTRHGPHYPIPMQDAMAAVKFIRSHAADYGVDPARIAVGGDSAGGGMALLLGLVKDHSIFKDDSYPGVSSEVEAVINFYGPTDLLTLSQLNFYLKDIGSVYLGGLLKDRAEEYREASPITHVRKDAPPILTLHGDQDFVVPFEQAESLHEAILKAEGRSLLVKVTGAGHNWVPHFNSSASLRSLPAVIQFLDRVFPQQLDRACLKTANPL